ncbi:hypothetical protein OHA74_52745 [Streptomyces phaeochromogenes]|uniref:hypothetical protein n=1 Tax=Streptomyces phaeochromogenes TaxID=1923 RepID=UPI002E2DC7B0|nr:hypothetical protein [Streptomyces phaeochromogenes]
MTYVNGTRNSLLPVSRPPGGGLDTAPPVRAFRVDDPQLHEPRERGRVAFLAEPQHPRSPLGHPRRFPVITVVVLVVQQHALAAVVDSGSAVAQTRIREGLDRLRVVRPQSSKDLTQGRIGVRGEQFIRIFARPEEHRNDQSGEFPMIRIQSQGTPDHLHDAGSTPLRVRAEVRRSVYLFWVYRDIRWRLMAVLTPLLALDIVLMWTNAYSTAFAWLPENDTQTGESFRDPDTPWISYIVFPILYWLFFQRTKHERIYSMLRNSEHASRNAHNALPALCAILLAQSTLALYVSIPRRRSAYKDVDRAAMQLVRALPKMARNRRLVSPVASHRKQVKEHTDLVLQRSLP